MIAAALHSLRLACGGCSAHLRALRRGEARHRPSAGRPVLWHVRLPVRRLRVACASRRVRLGIVVRLVVYRAGAGTIPKPPGASGAWVFGTLAIVAISAVSARCRSVACAKCYPLQRLCMCGGEKGRRWRIYAECCASLHYGFAQCMAVLAVRLRSRT